MRVNESQLEWIASKSLINCHAAGIDSVMFKDTPGSRIRAFICNEDHVLWQNTHDLSAGPLSLAFHPHHCDIVLVPIFGEPVNITAKMRQSFRAPLGEFIYQSKIITGKGEFVWTGKRFHYNTTRESMVRPIQMYAKDIHTVYLEKGKTAAWFVYEGEEDPTYTPLCYSNTDLEHTDFSNLYQPMSVDYLLRKLEQLGVEVVRAA